MTETTVHAVAASGFNTGNDLYDRVRPSYPVAALSYLRNAVNAPSGQINVVEIGAGTGLFTKAFIVHPEWKGAFKELRAVEPAPNMRRVFEETIKEPSVSIVDGTFEQTGIPDGWADVVVIAQAFHWCQDFSKASEEFGRILKPSGVLALIWNLEDREGAAWVAQVRDCYEKFEGDTPQYHRGLWRRAFDTPGYKANFATHDEKTWKYTLPATKEIVIERAFSKSYITALNEEQSSKLQAEMAAAVEKGDGKVWVDQAKGFFEYPYETRLVICPRK